ncbi:MAG: MiaB/RimO family radical SAM methylthiotransferase, partial [Candidatus Omnitrophota bacterium]
VRQHAEDRVWSEIGRIVKKFSKPVKPANKGQQRTTNKSRPFIGLVGCMAQNYKDKAFARAPEVDFVVGPSDIGKIPDILKQVTSHHVPDASQKLFELKIWETDGLVRPEDIYHTGFHEDKDHAYVVISEGCSNYCSYCVVPYVRGELHNRGAQDILSEINEAAGRGISRVTLLGQNVNAYFSGEGSPEPAVSFAGLLGMIEHVSGVREITFMTSHPKDTSDDLFKAIAASEKIKKSLHLPVQSGSDRILGLMRRGYTRAHYLGLVERYRRLVPAGTISTDLIVGFPSESDDDFKATLDLMKEIRFDSAFLFKYSPRPGTVAERLPDDVEQAVKERRHKILLDFQKSCAAKNRSL